MTAEHPLQHCCCWKVACFMMALKKRVSWLIMLQSWNMVLPAFISWQIESSIAVKMLQVINALGWRWLCSFFCFKSMTHMTLSLFANVFQRRKHHHVYHACVVGLIWVSGEHHWQPMCVGLLDMRKGWYQTGGLSVRDTGYEREGMVGSIFRVSVAAYMIRLLCSMMVPGRGGLVLRLQVQVMSISTWDGELD